MKPPPGPIPEPVIPLLPEDPDAWAATTLKIAWLEQAHKMSRQFQQARRTMGLPSIFPDGHIEH